MRQCAVEETEALLNATAREILSEISEPVSVLEEWVDPHREGIQTGPFGAQLGSGDFIDRGVPVLRIGNVQYGALETSDLKYVSEEKAKQLERYIVREGDILFARMGTVGRSCVLPPVADGWIINYHIIRVALDKSQVEPRFIDWTIRASRDIEEYLDENIRGATRQGVNTKIVAGLPCRVPSLEEQREVVNCLDDLQAHVDDLKRLQAATATELDALLPSILDKAFRGSCWATKHN